MGILCVGGCSIAPSVARGPVSHTDWESEQGGVLRAAPECGRATAALGRLTTDVSHVKLSIRVLDAGAPVAFSFDDGCIYVARGLVDRLDDDQLAAVVAHELGHLVHDGVITSAAALRGVRGGSANEDVERIADALGRQLLATHGVPTSALPSALEKVADASRGTAYFRPLIARSEELRRMDGADRQASH